MVDFTHLHLHTDGSFLDSAITVPKLVAKAKELGLKSLGISDHGSLSNSFKFFREAVDNDIKPIIGMEAYLVSDVEQLKITGQKPKRYHLTLIASNKEGWQNILKLHTYSYRDYFHMKPCIDYNLLKKHNEGLIALSGCMNGHIVQSLIDNNKDEALRIMLLMKDIFGDRFYAEIQKIGVQIADNMMPSLANMAQSNGVKIVASNDVHFLEASHHTIHSILTCVSMGKQFGSDDLVYPKSLYLKSSEEMYQSFGDMKEACLNTLEISERCTLDLKTKQSLYPVYKVPEEEIKEYKDNIGDYKLLSFAKNDQDIYLYHLARNGFFKRLPVEIHKDKTKRMIYGERLAYELKMIFDMGYSSYHLVVWDFINWCRKSNIPVGPGRGSSAGSLVCYCIGITQIEPIKADLIFERYLNPGRKDSPPDIDTDISSRRRDDVIQYVFDKYGHDNCSLIGTFGTIKVKTAIRDAGKVLGLSIAETSEISKSVPEIVGVNFQIALEMSPKFVSFYEKRKTDKKYELLFKFVEEFEGAMHHSGKHAAGVVIGPCSDIKPDDYIPMFFDRDTQRSFSAVDMKDVEKAGLLKMDFLAIDNLDQIAETLKLAGYNGTYYDFLDSILSKDLEDKNIIDAVFKNQNSLGIFQFEREGMMGYMKQLGITEFEDLVVLTSAARPGAKDFIPYMADCKAGIREPDYDDQRLESILKGTWGVILYQEQAIQLFREMAGFTLTEADLARRAIGKKKKEDMESLRGKFIDGSTKNGYSHSCAEKIFEKIALHSGYSFNRAHAYCYSVVGWLCALLKTYYTVEFMAVNLTFKDKSKIKQYIEESNRLGIIVLPPSVQFSKADFSVEIYDINKYKNNVYFDQLYRRFDKSFNGSKVIRFGTGKINGVPESYDFSEKGPYKDIFDFVSKNPTINKKAFEQLIYAGGFDDFGIRREVFLENADSIVKGARYNKIHEAQTSLFDEVEDDNPEESMKPAEKEWDLKTLFAKETDVLGNCFIISFDEAFGKEIDEYASGKKIKDFIFLPKGQNCIFVGIIYSKKVHKSRKSGEQMMFLTVGDYNEQVEVAMFGKSLKASAERMGEEVSEDLFNTGDIVVVKAVSQGNGSFIGSYLKRI